MQFQNKIKWMILSCNGYLLLFSLLDGDVTSFFVVASKPHRFVKMFSDISDFKERNECMPVEIIK